MAKRLGKKRGGPPPKRAIRNLIFNFDARNRAECRFIHPDEIERQIRAQVQRDYPDLHPAEIEVRVERRVARGMQPHRPVPHALR